MNLDQFIVLVTGTSGVVAIAVSFINKRSSGFRKDAKAMAALEQLRADFGDLKDEFKLYVKQQENDKTNDERMLHRLEKIEDKIESLVNNFWKFIGGKNKE